MAARTTPDIEDGPDRPVEQAFVLVGGPSEPALPVTGDDPAPFVAQAERPGRLRPCYHRVGQPIFAVTR